MTPREWLTDNYNISYEGEIIWNNLIRTDVDFFLGLFGEVIQDSLDADNDADNNVINEIKNYDKDNKFGFNELLN